MDRRYRFHVNRLDADPYRFAEAAIERIEALVDEQARNADAIMMLVEAVVTLKRDGTQES
jgi:hypothetical protein